MSHGKRVHPYPEAVKVREPVARPLDVVAVEMLLSGSQAFLAGVLMYLAVGIWNDRGVGVGPVAVILGLLAIAVGASWLYWLLGGMGWPLAAANVPTAMFLGFALILGWQGDGLIRLDALPLLLALSASVFGVIAGVFLDSPRRWRWDQRQRLRPGTEVPRVSDTTRAAVARMPRSLPTRSTVATGAVAGAGATVQSTPAASDSGGTTRSPQSADVGRPYVAAGSDDDGATSVPEVDDHDAMADAPSDPRDGDSSDVGNAATVPSSSAKVDAVDASAADRKARAKEAKDAKDAIELPTSVEPKAQRSPWAWAAPPEWTRDEDDDAANSDPKARP